LRTHVEAHPSNLSHGRNRRKTLQIARTNIRPKIPLKIKKWKTFQHIERGDSIQTHRCIDANQEFIRCGNHNNILPLFGELEGSLTLSPLLSYTMKHTLTSQKTTMARGWERDGWMATSPPALDVLIIGRLITNIPLWHNTTKTAKLG
jgi:hypothetical protein